jgi:hypothetical protein
MDQHIKVGNVDVVLPKGLELANTPKIVAEKPDTSQATAPQEYIFRTSDAFQYHVDQAKAVSNISSRHKPWVKRTWFVLFVVFPVIAFEALSIGILLGDGTPNWEGFLLMNAVGLPFVAIYMAIWRRKARRRRVEQNLRDR